MIPAGYMAKRVVSRPEWIAGAPNVDDIFSVSGCISEPFADFIKFWKHNGYWLFDAPDKIIAVAKEAGASLAGTSLFYYEEYEQEFNQESERWEPFAPELSFRTCVIAPEGKLIEGYDVVSFYARTSPECSPLSCNNLARSLPVNVHCLFASFEEAFSAVGRGAFKDGEPGPLRIFSVYSVPGAWPNYVFTPTAEESLVPSVRLGGGGLTRR